MTRCLAALLVALGIAEPSLGCSALSRQADTTRYFVLTPTAAAQRKPVNASDRSVGIGPLKIPDHLQDYLVTRLADEEIAISDTERWDEPLRASLDRVLRQNLMSQLGTERIFIYPWDPAAPPDLAVAIEVFQFERTTKGTADVRARWSLARGSDRAPLLTDEASISQPIVGTDARATVAALSAALGQLSQQIADQIRRAPRSGS